MKTRVAAAILLGVGLLAAPLPARLGRTAAAAPETLPAAALKGEPKIDPGKAQGVWVWADDQAIHVRWSSDGTPALFAGTLALDKPAGAITRVNKLAGGWVQLHGDRIVMFSATARDAVDGFDVVLAGRGATLDLQLDGKPLEVTRVFFGEGRATVKELPVKLKVGM